MQSLSLVAGSRLVGKRSEPGQGVNPVAMARCQFGAAGHNLPSNTKPQLTR